MSLIYDVGMHLGEDTAFYLKKGFDVVGIEANPVLSAQCADSFAEHVHSGRLTIINKAIAEQDDRVIDFHVFDEASIWGTASAAWAERNERQGVKSRAIRVPTTTLGQVIAEHGVPHYMKIDIEGFDHVCLEQLRDAGASPKFVSVESSATSRKETMYQLELLDQLGYTQFKIVAQHQVDQQTCPEPAREGAFVDHRFERHSSGLFGEELPGEWLTLRATRSEYRKIHFAARTIGPINGVFRNFPVTGVRNWLGRLFWRGSGWGWYDTHARQ